MSNTKKILEAVKQRVNSSVLKNNLWWIFGILIILLIIVFSLSYLLPAPKANTPDATITSDYRAIIREAISFLCGIASVFGIAVALLQNVDNNDLITTTEKLVESEDTYKKKLNEEISKVQTSHNKEIKKIRVEITKQQDLDTLGRVEKRLNDVITYLGIKDLQPYIELIIWLCDQIYVDIKPFSILSKLATIQDSHEELKKHITNLTTNNNHFHESKTKGTGGLSVSDIRTEFKEFHNTIVTLKAKIRHSQ